MRFNDYLINQKFLEGTILELEDISSVYVEDSGYLTQTQRGIISGDACHNIYTTIQEWLDSLPSPNNPEEDYHINVWPSDSSVLVPASYPIYASNQTSPYLIVKDVLLKNNVKFKCINNPSQNMRLARAKIDLLKLESDNYWLKTRISNVQAWQSEFYKRDKELDEIKAIVNTMTIEEADKKTYHITGTKYPRVFVKKDDVMLPIYYTSDGSKNIIFDGKCGTNWHSVGIQELPEFWISQGGKMTKQQIIFFTPSSYLKPGFHAVEMTQMELALRYNFKVDVHGCSPNGTQVFNPTTLRFLQLWEIV